MERLPDGVLEIIFSMLQPKHMLSLATVCSSWYVRKKDTEISLSYLFLSNPIKEQNLAERYFMEEILRFRDDFRAEEGRRRLLEAILETELSLVI